VRRALLEVKEGGIEPGQPIVGHDWILSRRGNLSEMSGGGGEAKNLEVIAKAIDQHNANCRWPAAEVRMSPFEVERLGWDEIRGLPIVADPNLGTGRFRIVCSREGEGAGIEETEAIGTPVEVGVGGDEPPVPPV
jgi:hypothetical protein